MSESTGRGGLAGALAIVLTTWAATGCEKAEPTLTPSQQAVREVRAGQAELYQPTRAEWLGYLRNVEAWMQADANRIAQETGKPLDAEQQRRRAFAFPRSFDGPPPRCDANPAWEVGTLIVLNTFDMDLGLQVNGVPFGTLESGQRWELPVSRGTVHVIELMEPEVDVDLRRSQPYRPRARFLERVE